VRTGRKVSVFVATAVGTSALTFPSYAAAQAASNSGFRTEYRLTDQEKEQVLAAAEAKGKQAKVPRGLIEDPVAPPAIQGEVGFSLGTDGSRSAFGSAFYPLGPSGGAMISIDMDRFGHLPQPLIVANPNR
jgi:hypothetical protein